MARLTEPTTEQERMWREWVATLPDSVRVIAERFEPWSLYRMKSTGQRVTVLSYSEDGTITVNVSADHNLTTFERNVFGIDPSDLEPCELPSADEPVGAMMSADEIAEDIDALRVVMRPDLFVMGEDGKAIRKN